MKLIQTTIALAVVLMSSPSALLADQPIATPDRGVWLGVQLCPVPTILAGHLQLGEAGLMVRNVFIDSPADVAGLDRYDVIVKADGKEVVGNVRALNRQISEKKTGDTLELDIYHKGQPGHLKITLTARPSEWSELKRKYPHEQEWYDWDSLRDRFSVPKEWMDHDWGQRFRDYGDDAYDLWRKQKKQHRDALKDWRKQYEKYNESLRQWRKRMQESLSTDKWEQWQEWYDDFFEGPMQEIQPPAHNEDEWIDIPTTQSSPLSDVRFEKQPDGKIIVHLRKNNAAYSETFKSQDDLKKNAPKLYEQYKLLQEKIR